MQRTVQLFCPSSSKAVQLVTNDDQRLDLGSIARTFGLDPATVKLNGHFISRGLDLIASSVTWKSLISFFSSRGLATGTGGSAALVVDGKCLKSGSKRNMDDEKAGDGALPEATPSLPTSAAKVYNSMASPSCDMHSQATAYARLAESASLRSEPTSNEVISELTDESGITVFPVSAQETGLLPNRKADAKGSDIVLESILEADVARNAKQFFAQPQNVSRSE